MNMKKIAVLALSLCMIAAIAVTGTIAYFTDTDNATNTFTVGGVNIELVEKEEDLETDFEQDKELIPGTSKSNNVAKRAWIHNDGKNDAWVWAKVYVPTVLDDVNNASNNSLHFNNYGQFTNEYTKADWTAGYSQTPITDGVFGADKKPAVENMVEYEEKNLWSDFVNIDSDKEGYTCYITKMNGTLEAGKNSLPFLRQVYMDERVKQCTNPTHTNCMELVSGAHTSDLNFEWKVIVEAYAIQDADFADVDAAIAAYDKH